MKRYVYKIENDFFGKINSVKFYSQADFYQAVDLLNIADNHLDKLIENKLSNSSLDDKPNRFLMEVIEHYTEDLEMVILYCIIEIQKDETNKKFLNEIFKHRFCKLFNLVFENLSKDYSIERIENDFNIIPDNINYIFNMLINIIEEDYNI